MQSIKILDSRRYREVLQYLRAKPKEGNDDIGISFVDEDENVGVRGGRKCGCCDQRATALKKVKDAQVEQLEPCWEELAWNRTHPRSTEHTTRATPKRHLSRHVILKDEKQKNNRHRS